MIFCSLIVRFLRNCWEWRLLMAVCFTSMETFLHMDSLNWCSQKLSRLHGRMESEELICQWWGCWRINLVVLHDRIRNLKWRIWSGFIHERAKNRSITVTKAVRKLNMKLRLKFGCKKLRELWMIFNQEISMFIDCFRSSSDGPCTWAGKQQQWTLKEFHSVHTTLVRQPHIPSTEFPVTERWWILTTECAKFGLYRTKSPQARPSFFTVIGESVIKELCRWMEQCPDKIQASVLTDQCRLESEVDHLMMVLSCDCSVAFVVEVWRLSSFRASKRALLKRFFFNLFIAQSLFVFRFLSDFADWSRNCAIRDHWNPNNSWKV
jgi:hypothetical protein